MGLFDFEKSLIKDFMDSIKQAKQMHNPRGIEMRCPYCSFFGHMKTGDFKLLGKDMEGYIHWRCIKCGKEFKYDSLGNKSLKV